MKNLQIIQTLEIEKNKFLDEKHLDWYVETYIRNYPEFLEMDYQKAMYLAKQHFQDYEVLTQYIVDLNNSYISAKSYLCIEQKLLLNNLLWSHNADTNPFECLTQKGTKKPITGAFFLSARNRGLFARSEEEATNERHERAKTADFKAELILSVE